MVMRSMIMACLLAGGASADASAPLPHILAKGSVTAMQEGTITITWQEQSRDLNEKARTIPLSESPCREWTQVGAEVWLMEQERMIYMVCMDECGN